NEGATIPFIARYRKEITGSLDEVQIASIRDLLKRYQELEKRREAIEKSIAEQNKLTEELKQKLKAAETMSSLEDLYLPYKPKRKTRASMARDKGLQALADLLLDTTGRSIESEVSNFINPTLGVETEQDALAGARDILAEQIAENAE